MGLASLFGRKAPPDAAARARVADWVRQAADLPAEVIVKVSEIACPDPACPGDETVLLLMPPGERTRALKIAKPLAAVTEADVREALAPGT